jgi:hypothetical protein
MTLDMVLLTGSVLTYGLATLLLADASTRGIRAAAHNPVWIAGTGFQAVAFLLAFVARRGLPLLVVQPAITSSITVTYLLGAMLGRWPFTRRDLLALALVLTGLTGLGVCARTGPARHPGMAGLLVLFAFLIPCVAAAWISVQRAAPRHLRALAVGAVAGLAFGISAVGARAVAAHPVAALCTLDGLVALVMVAIGILLGQVLFTAALSGGAVAGPSAVMHVVETVGPALAGVILLGDVVVPGREWLAAVCTAVSLSGSLMLAGHGVGVVPAGTAPSPERDQ